MKTVFIRALDTADKEAAIRAVVASTGGTVVDTRRFFIDLEEFRLVPRAPFAYWVPAGLRSLFGRIAPLENSDRIARQGGINGNDFRWLRLWWETSRCLEGRGPTPIPIAKGGPYSRFYLDLPLDVLWDSVHRTFFGFTGLPHRPSTQPACVEHYFRAGLTWSRRTQAGLSVRVMPAGCVFADRGPSLFVSGDEPVTLKALLAVTNSTAFRALVGLQMAFGSYEVGVIQRTPVPAVGAADARRLGLLVDRVWSLKRSMDSCRETARGFIRPALLESTDASLRLRGDSWGRLSSSREDECRTIEAEMDDCCFALYGIDQQERVAATAVLGEKGRDLGEADEATAYSSRKDGLGEEDSETDESLGVCADPASLTADLLSWSIGVAFGRFDLRLATGERALPPEPDPFDPLPVSSPGMLTGPDGLPCSAPPPGYPIDIPQDGVLLDDPGHPRDLTASARAVFDVVFGGDADARWQEAAGILDPKNHDLRAFVARTFFEQHLKRYSKSRRKAPIYWQLATPSASYSVWLYAHRLSPDTFFHVLHDVVAPKLGLEERKLLSMTQEFGPIPTASQRKEIAGQEAFVEELRAFRDEVTRVAPLWKPDLDDGVVLTMAPLWRLVPQHRAWQKELKAARDSLSAGEYDWAHVAMHLWPERVVPKCATDRSLAIAHGLEEVFWEEDAKGKWVARSKPLRSIEALVRERASPAVRAAVSGIIDTGVPLSVPGGGRKRRAR